MAAGHDLAHRIHIARTSHAVAAEAHAVIVIANVTDIGVAMMTVITIDQVEVQGVR
jgi:hypothetical protein